MVHNHEHAKNAPLINDQCHFLAAKYLGIRPRVTPPGSPTVYEEHKRRFRD